MSETQVRQPGELDPRRYESCGDGGEWTFNAEMACRDIIRTLNAMNAPAPALPEPEPGAISDAQIEAAATGEADEQPHGIGLDGRCVDCEGPDPNPLPAPWQPMETLPEKRRTLIWTAWPKDVMYPVCESMAGDVRDGMRIFAWAPRVENAERPTHPFDLGWSLPPSEPERPEAKPPTGELGLQGTCRDEPPEEEWDGKQVCARCMSELRAMARENDDEGGDRSDE